MGTRSAWTPERRARQSEIIRGTRPWRSSTGPKSAGGKRRSSRNARRFRDDPEQARAYSLINQFLRDGKMTAELGALFLKHDLSMLGIDTILKDDASVADDGSFIAGELFVADREFTADGELLADDEFIGDDEFLADELFGDEFLG